MKTRTYIQPPPLRRALWYGHRGRDVLLVQGILQEEGFLQETPMGNFNGPTREAVRYFQGTHIGKEGNFLEVDGIVGPKTWWALFNPNGSAQQNHISTPEDTNAILGPHTYAERAAVVRYLYELHAKGVKEVPDGSNYGDGVTPIVNACGFRYGIYWCLAVAVYAHAHVTKAAPLGAMHVHCATFWNKALANHKAHLKGRYTPIPGDIAIYNYRGGPDARGRLHGAGHATTVVRVSHDGKVHNAIEGNAGNRLKHSMRHEADKSLVGYVNLWGDEKNPPQFRRGITKAPIVELSLAGSR